MYTISSTSLESLQPLISLNLNFPYKYLYSTLAAYNVFASASLVKLCSNMSLFLFCKLLSDNKRSNSSFWKSLSFNLVSALGFLPLPFPLSANIVFTYSIAVIGSLTLNIFLLNVSKISFALSTSILFI